MVIKLFKILLVLSLIVILIALLLPAVHRGRPGALRTQCKNNFKQILLAMASYESAFHAFPPAHTVDADGNPLHSWRTLILPYLDQQKLYDSIDLAKPWNDPVNKEAYESAISAYICPSTDLHSDKPDSRPNKTTYMAVVTPNSCLRSTVPRELAEIEDGHDQTLLIIEVSPESAVHWMAPVDADEKMVLSFGATPNPPHQGGTFAAMVDGKVRFLNDKTPQETIRALISASGHESVGYYE